MKRYISGDSIIKTTEKRYEEEFKAMGYKPYIEKNIEDIDKKINTKKKLDKDE